MEKNSYNSHYVFAYEQGKCCFQSNCLDSYTFERDYVVWKHKGALQPWWCLQLGQVGVARSPHLLSSQQQSVCQQCTVIWWKPIDVFYSIPMLLQPWDELHEDRHPCHVLVGDVKWWLFYLKLGSDHWKRLLGDLWFGARFIALGMFVYCVGVCTTALPLWYVMVLCKRPPCGPLMLHVFSGLEVLYIYCINAECHKIK